jgi:hypothetical protein
MGDKRRLDPGTHEQCKDEERHAQGRYRTHDLLLAGRTRPLQDFI